MFIGVMMLVSTMRLAPRQAVASPWAFSASVMIFVDGPVVLGAEAEAGADKERERSRLREAVAWAVAA